MTTLEPAAKALYDTWLKWPEVVREQKQNGPHPSWEKLDFEGQARWYDMAHAARRMAEKEAEGPDEKWSKRP